MWERVFVGEEVDVGRVGEYATLWKVIDVGGARSSQKSSGGRREIGPSRPSSISYANLGLGLILISFGASVNLRL